MGYQKPRTNEEMPKVTEEIGHGGSVETTVKHPAFAQVSVSRRSQGGNGANLYDSDFGHNSYVVVEVKRSELHRDLSRDWHFDREHIVQFAFSESQWATFVSSFNNGSGTPATLLWESGKGYVPGIPTFDRADIFKKEAKTATQEAVDGINKLIESVKDSGLSKKKQDDLLSGAYKAIKSLTDVLPFIHDQFNEHVEETVEKGYQEIHGYMNAVISRAGIAAINNGFTPLEIDNGIKEEKKGLL